MRRSIRLASLLALGLLFGFTACRQPTTREGKRPKSQDEQAAELRLPDPLPLPEQPKVASWIAQPGVALAMISPYSPVPIDVRAGAEFMLGRLTEPALAAELARGLDLRAPFSNVVLDDGQEVIRLSLTADARTTVAGRLGELEKVGEFGAVRLPNSAPPSTDGKPARAPTREWLAWIDEGDGGSLVLANSLEGLVTGRTLAGAYGREPVFFTIDPSQLAGIPIEVPFSRVTAHGDLSAVVIEAQAIEGQNPLADLPITAGTLAGLLDASQISAGASSRYAHHQETVRDVIVEVNSQVAQLPFLVRGIGENIAGKLATALRTWDGRVLAAMGPSHVRLAYGAGDVEKSRVAVLRLLQSIVDNVALARNFSSEVPKMSLRRKVSTADGADIELFVLHDAARIARELQPLTDDEGRLNIAMAWTKRAGGGMIVIGPKAQQELARWLDDTKGSIDDATTQAQLLAASFAADPEQLRPLLDNPEVGLEQLVNLSATGPKWQLTVDDQGAGKYVIGVVTPGPPKPPRAATR